MDIDTIFEIICGKIALNEQKLKEKDELSIAHENSYLNMILSIVTRFNEYNSDCVIKPEFVDIKKYFNDSVDHIRGEKYNDNKRVDLTNLAGIKTLEKYKQLPIYIQEILEFFVNIKTKEDALLNLHKLEWNFRQINGTKTSKELRKILRKLCVSVNKKIRLINSTEYNGKFSNTFSEYSYKVYGLELIDSGSVKKSLKHIANFIKVFIRVIGGKSENDEEILESIKFINNENLRDLYLFSINNKYKEYCRKNYIGILNNYTWLTFSYELTEKFNNFLEPIDKLIPDYIIKYQKLALENKEADVKQAELNLARQTLALEEIKMKEATIKQLNSDLTLQVEKLETIKKSEKIALEEMLASSNNYEMVKSENEKMSEQIKALHEQIASLNEMNNILQEEKKQSQLTRENFAQKLAEIL